MLHVLILTLLDLQSTPGHISLVSFQLKVIPLTDCGHESGGSNENLDTGRNNPAESRSLELRCSCLLPTVMLINTLSNRRFQFGVCAHVKMRLSTLQVALQKQTVKP